MPLDPVHGKLAVLDGFNCAVFGAFGYDFQLIAQYVDRLVVDGIDLNPGFVESYRKESPAPANRHFVNFFVPFVRTEMELAIGKVLDERTPEIHVDKLHAFANSEHGLFGGDDGLHEPEKEPVVLGNEFHRSAKLGSVERGVDIRPSGKHETVEILDVRRNRFGIAGHDISDSSGLFDGGNVPERYAVGFPMSLLPVIRQDSDAHSLSFHSPTVSGCH